MPVFLKTPELLIVLGWKTIQLNQVCGGKEQTNLGIYPKQQQTLF